VVRRLSSRKEEAMAKPTTYARRQQTLFERAKLLGGGVLFGIFAYAAFTGVPGSEGVIVGFVCLGISLTGFVSGIRGYDELKKR
jgi:hypothetical protein